MCPPDPDRDAARASSEEEDEEEEAADAYDLASLRLREDVSGILALAKAYRAGNERVARDMAKCLEAYRAAAELGSAEASYAVALFYANGGVVPQDLKEAATHLRAAAEKGSVPAKVYLGNLYELGVFYKADAEKADVWYRNAARGAKVEAAPGTDEWTQALAELGCVRYVLARTKDDGVDEAEKARLLARAKAHGHGLRVRSEDSVVPASDLERPTFVNALEHAASTPADAPTGTPPPVAVEIGARERKDTTPETKAAKAKVASAVDEKEEAKKKLKADAASKTRREGLAAFGYAILFALAGVGAAYAAMAGAKELVAHGQVLPLVKTNVRLLFPIVLGLVGVLPAALVYKGGAFVKAVVAAAAFGGIGWVAWGTGQAALHVDRAAQAISFGLAGFLATLFVLGLLGGAKASKAAKPRP